VSIVVAPRFNGPPGSGNGGYVCGVLAGRLLGADAASAVVVTLRRPPPLSTPLSVVTDGDGVTRLVTGSEVVAEAADGPLPVDAVDPVPFPAARDAETRYGGLVGHPFPTCFVCGTERDPGDALLLAPGPTDDGTTACTWVPDASLGAGTDGSLVAPEFVWAALDCPGAWTSDVAGRPIVLGRMTARIESRPHVGEPCVVVGRLLGVDGRKTWTATTAYGSDGRELGRAHATWIAVA
jgi:hypothetical protein